MWSTRWKSESCESVSVGLCIFPGIMRRSWEHETRRLPGSHSPGCSRPGWTGSSLWPTSSRSGGIHSPPKRQQPENGQLISNLHHFGINLHQRHRHINFGGSVDHNAQQCSTESCCVKSSAAVFAHVQTFTGYSHRLSVCDHAVAKGCVPWATKLPATDPPKLGRWNAIACLGASKKWILIWPLRLDFLLSAGLHNKQARMLAGNDLKTSTKPNKRIAVTF